MPTACHLKNVIVLLRPDHLLPADFEAEVLEGAVVRLPMQLLRQHNDAVAVEKERVLGVFGDGLGD